MIPFLSSIFTVRNNFVQHTLYEVIRETVQILNNIKEKYEDHHNVNYTPDAIEACVKLTERYITDRHLPDKAIDALDEAGSRVHISNIVVPETILKLEEQIEETKENKINRITSYNVCYTKLLRFQNLKSQS